MNRKALMLAALALAAAGPQNAGAGPTPKDDFRFMYWDYEKEAGKWHLRGTDIYTVNAQFPWQMPTTTLNLSDGTERIDGTDIVLPQHTFFKIGAPYVPQDKQPQIAGESSGDNGLPWVDWLYPVGLIGVAAVAYRPIKRRLGQRESDKKSREFNSLPIIQEAARRCPVEKFPRINEQDPDAIEGWENLLAKWPNAPATDEERISRETLMWQNYAGMFSDEASGKPVLQPKGDIIDRYKHGEKWVLREYYMATSHYIEPWEGPEHQRLRADMDAKYQRWHKYRHAEKTETRAYSEYQESLKAWKTYNNEKRKEMLEKQGGWFFANVERAFAEMHGLWNDSTAPPVGAMPDTGEAVAVDEYKPNT